MFASKICRPEATLALGRSHVHFFQDCQECVIHPHRSKEAFAALIEDWQGIVVSDG